MLTIVASNLGKRYDLGSHMQRNARLGEKLTELWRRSPETREAREFWALRGVTLDIEQGDVVGLVGRNGAGKSTLLKLLSRITLPTEGRAVLHGRVGSLLEVGTGFHTELTGRENALLNGVILGMTRRDIIRCLNDIVDFSEIGAFFDTPVKRYSSGMYMRLAFSVAAFLRTEILLVDEVLAVGDLPFQQRCLGKMGELSRSGRTVIFVSHNLGAVSQLCRKAAWLDCGRLRQYGAVEDVLAGFVAATSGADGGSASWRKEVFDPTMTAEVVGAHLAPPNASDAGTASCDDGVSITLDVRVRQREPGMSVAFYLRNARGVVVVSSDILHTDVTASERLRIGLHRFRVDLEPRLLAPDTYTLSAMVRSPYHGDLDEVHDACRIEIVDLTTATGARRAGVIGLNLPWRHELLATDAESA